MILKKNKIQNKKQSTEDLRIIITLLNEDDPCVGGQCVYLLFLQRLCRVGGGVLSGNENSGGNRNLEEWNRRERS